MVDGSAQRGARESRSRIGWERGYVRGGSSIIKCVVVQGGKGGVCIIVAYMFFAKYFHVEVCGDLVRLRPLEVSHLSQCRPNF